MIVWEDFIQLFFFLSTLSARTGLLGVLSCWRGCKVEQMQSLLGSKCRQQPSYLISQHPPGLWETGGHQRTRATNLFISVALSVHDALPFCARTPDLFDIILLLVFYRSTSFLEQQVPRAPVDCGGEGRKTPAGSSCQHSVFLQH